MRTSGELGERFVTVLGNHDLHLLARAAGLSDSKRLDTLEGVLAAHDRRDLLEWLRVQPILHRDTLATSGEPVVLVHAGLLPSWSLEQAEEKAAAIQRELERHGVLLHRRPTPNEPPRLQAMREDLAVFTRLRACDPAGRPVPFNAAPEEAPEGVIPWFDHPMRRALNDRGVVLFGHWAAMGLHVGEHEIGLDSGCAWGGPLTALRLEDRQIFQVPRRDPEPVGRGLDDDE